MSRALNRPDVLALVSGVAAAGLVLAVPASSPVAPMVAMTVIGGMIAWIVWQDARELTIPDGPLVALGLLGAALRLAATADPAVESAVLAMDALLCGGTLLAVREGYYRWKGYDGLGFGDVKLAAAGGMLVGTEGFAHALLAASLSGLALVLARSRAHRSQGPDRLPFGAFLAPACGIVYALSQV